MNPLRLTAENYRTYQALDLTFPDGPLAIVGPNGAGKSSIVNALDLALFGGRDLSRHLSRGGDSETMTLALEFEHAGERYRVRRTYKATGRGSTKVDFEQRQAWGEVRNGPPPTTAAFDDGGAWLSLTRESARATDEAISEIIGLSRETFRASSFMGQGQGALFTEATPADRKQILSEILGLSFWDRLGEQAKAARSRVEQELNRIAGALELAEHELKGKDELVAARDIAEVQSNDAKLKLAAAEESLQQAEQLLAKARETQAALAAATALAAEREQALVNVRRQLADLDTLASQIEAELQGRATFEAEAGTVSELENTLVAARKEESDYAQLQVERRGVEAEAKRCVAEIAALDRECANLESTLAEKLAAAKQMREAEAPTCYACRQLVDDEAKETALAALHEEIQHAKGRFEMAKQNARALVEAHGKASKRLREIDQVEPASPSGPVETKLASARSAQERLAVLGQREARGLEITTEIERLRTQLPELEERHTQAAAERDALLASLPDSIRLAMQGVSVVDHSVEHARAEVERCRRVLETADRDLTRCDERLQRLGELEARAAEQRDHAERERKELDVLVACERAYGRDGIPALILENAAIPQLESEAGRVCALLGRSYTFELRTQCEKKSGDGLKEALDIVVHRPEGAFVYEELSGGEKMRVDLSLRIALGRLLAHRRGAEVSLLVVDEPYGLDAEGRELLAELLPRLSTEFAKIVLVSHHEDISDAFDRVIRVQGGAESGEPSRIDGPGVPEAVAA